MYNAVLSLDGDPQKCFGQTASNASQALTEQHMTLPNGQRPIGALITCETYGIRFWLNGTDPGQDFGHPLAAGGSLRISGAPGIKGFRFCNDTAGSNGVLMVTLSF